jgi:hypothetical protein
MQKRELLHATLTRRFAPTSPDTEWQRDLSATDQGIGGALGAQGDAPGELVAYCTSLAISEALAACSANAQWQHDVSNPTIHDRRRAGGPRDSWRSTCDDGGLDHLPGAAVTLNPMPPLLELVSTPLRKTAGKNDAFSGLTRILPPSAPIAPACSAARHSDE